MKLKILSVGHKMPSWVDSGCAEYLKRMPKELATEIIEIKPDKRAAGKNSEVVQEAESKRILEVAGKDYLVVLDERGQEVTSLQLATKMEHWQTLGKDLSLVIGGADGIHTALKQKADWLWSLSKLTMPHGLVRIMLCEQLYRGYSVTQHHPYHKE